MDNVNERETASLVRSEAELIEATEGANLAGSESLAAESHAQLRALKRMGYKTVRWVTQHDDKVRDSHRRNEQHGPVKIGRTFPNGLRYPHDPQGPPEETINCRCRLEGAER